MIRSRIPQFVKYLFSQFLCSKGGVLIGRITGQGPAQEIELGTGLAFAGGKLTATAVSGPPSFDDVTGKPTTLAGYGITDAGPALTYAGADPNAGAMAIAADFGGGVESLVLSLSGSEYSKTIGVYGYFLYADVGLWYLEKTGDTTSGFVSSTTAASPDIVGTWNAINGDATGTPTVTPSPIPGTYLGQLCKASAGWWRWNGDLWEIDVAATLTASKSVANAAARLGLTTELAEGFAVVDADTGKTWMLVAGGNPATSGDWLQLGDRDIQWADVGGKPSIVSGDGTGITDPAAFRTTLELGTAAVENTSPIIGQTIIDDGAEVYANAATSTQKPWSVTSGAGASDGDGAKHILVTTTAGTMTRFRRYVGIDMTNGCLIFDVKKDLNLSTILVRLKCGTQAASKDLATNAAGVLTNGVGVSPILDGTWYRMAMPLAQFENRTAGVTAADISNVWAIEIEITPQAATNTTLQIRTVSQIKGDGIGRVCFQFDDNRLDTYTTAFPILTANGFKGDVAAEYATVGDGTHGTLANLQELYASGWSIMGHHTVNMTSIGDAANILAHQTCKDFLLSNGFTRGADVWVWPGGTRDVQRENIAKRFWRVRRLVSTLSYYAHPGVYEPAACSIRYIGLGGAPSQYKTYLDRAKADGATVCFVFHSILSSPVAAEDYSIANFTEIVQHAAAIGMIDIRFPDLFRDYTERGLR